MLTNAGPDLEIAGRRIGGGAPMFLVAELSANHGGRLERALDLVAAAAEAGADAVKLQTYTADTMTIDCDEPPFVIEDGPWQGRRYHELYEEAHTPWEWHSELKRAAEAHGLVFFSTPFDATSVDFLESLDVPCFKIASFELTDLGLLRRVARSGRPVILSTGLSTFAEIARAVETLRSGGSPEVVLLKCTSAYPAPAAEMNLRTIPHLARAFGCPAGLSDHSLDPLAATVAASLGACMIEKHFTLSRADGGPDSGFSLEPAEFRGLVERIRAVEAALGVERYGPTAAEAPNRRFRRSLFVVADVAEGERFTVDNIRVIRPGFGLPSDALDLVLGRKAARAIRRGTPLSWGLVGGPGEGGRDGG